MEPVFSSDRVSRGRQRSSYGLHLGLPVAERGGTSPTTTPGMLCEVPHSRESLPDQ